jgi:peptide/nickel transport system substrate-binding protein
MVFMAGFIFARGGKPVQEPAEEKPATAMEPEPMKGFNEAPELNAMVRAGKIPPVSERLPPEPMVVKPIESIGVYGGVIRYPISDLGDLTGQIRDITYENLVRYDVDRTTIIGNLAEEFEIADSSKVFTFKLREGIRWSDGEPFSADDLSFWYNDIVMNKDLSPGGGPWFIQIGGAQGVMEQLDEYTVRFTFEATHGLFPVWMATQYTIEAIVPAHYLKQFHVDYADEAEVARMAQDEGLESWVQLFGSKKNYMTNPDLPVLFPYKLQDKPGLTKVVFERNPFYWKVDTAGNQLPYIDAWEWPIVRDIETLKIKALNGEFDLWPYVTLDDFTVFKEEEAKSGKFKILQREAFDIGCVVYLNQTVVDDPVLRELFQELNFRKALSIGIDREEMNELLYQGFAEPAWKAVLVDPSLWTGNEEIKALYDTYDPDEANRLLDELGLDKRDSRGVRLRSDGKPLEFTIEAVERERYVDPSNMIAQQWAKLGLNVNVKPVPKGAWRAALPDSAFEATSFAMQVKDWILTPDMIPGGNWSPLWGQWFASGGAAGEEPPERIKALQTLYGDILLASNSQERAERAKIFLLEGASQLNVFPDSGPSVWLQLVNANLGNYPEKTPGSAKFGELPELYYYKE